MRTRIRCPLCGRLAWKKSFDQGPYPVEAKGMTCKKSLGKGHGRNTFLYMDMTGNEFLANLQGFLKQKLKKVAIYWKMGLTEHDDEILQTNLDLHDQLHVLVKENTKLRGDIEWLKSKNVLAQTVSHTSEYPMVNTNRHLYANPKRNAMTNNVLITSEKNSRTL